MHVERAVNGLAVLQDRLMTQRRLIVGVLLALLVIAVATMFVLYPANTEQEQGSVPALVQ